MTDYSSMEAGRELDCEIATRLGWIVEHERVVWVDDGEGARPVAYMYGKRPKDGGYDDDVRIPPYSTDANAALTLVTGLDFRLIYDDFSRNWEAIIGNVYDDNATCYTWSDENPALTIAMTWLQWKEAQS